ncbi:MAG: response regulator [Acidobacteria bacterium]|nr:response regulator [Acidobacteriota bacterium]
MQLTPDEKKMLRGGDGTAAKEALELQIEVGKFFGAKRLVGVCDALEEMGRTGSLDGARFLLDRLQAESQCFDQELRMLSEATVQDGAAGAPNIEGIDLSGMAATFQGKRIVAQGLPERIAERLGSLLVAMDAHFRVLPEHAEMVEWRLAADLVILTGDQTEDSWAECRRLRKQVPRAGMVLLLDDPTLDSLDRTEELGAEVVSVPPELRDLLLRSYQQLQICRRPRTTFIEEPPAAAAEPEPMLPAASGLGSLAFNVGGAGPLRALVAEDDSLTARFLVSVLEANGFLADHADNGTRAVGMLSVRTYDAVLLDLNMPELDGYGVLSRLRQLPQYQDTPVLVLSARNQERDILRAFSLGASDYVTKPFSPPEVVFRLKRMVERA